MATTCRIPTTDLCAELRNDTDPEFGDYEVCTASNRHLRLYVAGWMLSDGTDAGDLAGLIAARSLYEGSGTGLLERPGRLTTADIVSEVLSLLP